ncbi:MAG: hypothetical protein WA777_19985 [Rhodanobacter sp.]
MEIWQSASIQIDGMTIDVRANRDGVTSGRMVNGVYASDLLMSPEQAIEYAEALTEGAAHCLAARKG